RSEIVVMRTKVQIALILSVLIGDSFAQGAEQTTQRAAELPAITELPDPFLRADGRRIQSQQDWPEQRRVLLEFTLRYEYGSLPEVPHNLVAEMQATRT